MACDVFSRSAGVHLSTFICFKNCFRCRLRHPILPRVHSTLMQETHCITGVLWKRVFSMENICIFTLVFYWNGTQNLLPNIFVVDVVCLLGKIIFVELPWYWISYKSNLFWNIIYIFIGFTFFQFHITSEFYDKFHIVAKFANLKN